MAQGDAKACRARPERSQGQLDKEKAHTEARAS